MHDRKVAIIKNKKCYMSSDYVRNIINTYRGRNKNNFPTDFFKIKKSENIDVSKEQPVLLYDKLRKRNISMENQVKKELADNFGYLNNAALKYNLLKFYSLNISNENLLKNKNKKNQNKFQNRLNLSSKTFYSLEKEKRKLQINYSEKVRKKFKSKSFQKSKNKIAENKFNNRYDSSDNKLDRNELMKEDYIKKLMDIKNKRIIINNIKRKKEYLDINSISYENIDIAKDDKKEKKDKRRVKIFKNGKYIKTKKEDKKVNERNEIFERKSRKKIIIKNEVDGFEYINKIKNEIKNLKSTNNNKK